MQFLPNLTPMLDGLQSDLRLLAVPLAAVLVTWSAFQEWSQRPEQFSAFSVIWRIVVAAVVVVVIYNIGTILNSVVGNAGP